MSWPLTCFHIFFLQLLLFSSQCSPKLCGYEQSSALLQFKQLFSFESYDAPPYPKMMSWKENNTDCCSWDGVECDMATGNVICLDLSCCSLYGNFYSNSSLFLLIHLQRINLAFNDFSYSEIPSDFSRFPNLTHLNLSTCNFVGQLPNEISHLSKLVSFDISSNDVKLETAVLEALVQNLTVLQELILDDIDMSAITLDSFRNLSTSLTSLSLTSSRLRGNFPHNIFHLPNLEMLNLGDNFGLTGIFRNVSSGNPLNFLDVSWTGLSGELPDSIGNLKSLRHLDVQYCNFTGSVPDSLGYLTQLTHLDLSYNHFGGHIPSSLSNLKQLIHLDLSYNNFIGEIPDIFANLTQLSYLAFSRNQLTGPIPDHVIGLRNLTCIFLAYNSLNGTIPSKLLTLPLLEYIDLNFNQLTGHIHEFQNNSLEHISLKNNRLDGSIPNSIFELEKLKSLELSENNLSGSLELDMFTNFKDLDLLDLSHNKISLNTTIKANSSFSTLYKLKLSSCNISEFPEILKSQYLLNFLDLSDNKIQGQIPNWMLEMGNHSLLFLNLSNNFLTDNIEQLPWHHLEYVDLRNNLLQGMLPIPPPYLKVFLISNNRLTGQIAHSFCGKSTYLEVLDVSNNSLNGTIPECMGKISNSLRVLDLRKNRFRGTIPATFGTLPQTSVNLDNLRTLNFNDNELEGPVPRSLVNCTMLEVLDFGNNKINDTFPYWLGTLPKLQVLIIRSNNFNGIIRASVGDYSFPKLRILDLSNNKFRGSLQWSFFENMKAMTNIDEVDKELEYMGEEYYQDSIIVTIKGSNIELGRILTTFTTVDFSNNYFDGEIPGSIGKLQALRLLNFSHNSLIGHIPSLLGSLPLLESLDLSSNRLGGEIPQQLTSSTFLQVFNVSDNRLVGPIPRGRQFDTFSSDSYSGNFGLCGFPLSNKCSTDEPAERFATSEDDTDSKEGFGWKVAVLMGYGCGALFGMLIGYLVFSSGKPKWLARIAEGENHRMVRIPNNKRRRRNLCM